MTRTSQHPLGLTFTLLLIFVAGFLVSAAPAAAGEPGPVAEGPPFRAAPPPSALERAQVERWHRAWRVEAAALERAFDAAIRAAEARDDRALRPRCLTLAGAVLDLDRSRILPAPDRAADLHLRRGLRHVARAAVTCLTKRPYAARYALEQAADAFAQAWRVLDRYGRTAQGGAAGPAPL